MQQQTREKAEDERSQQAITHLIPPQPFGTCSNSADERRPSCLHAAVSEIVGDREAWSRLALLQGAGLWPSGLVGLEWDGRLHGGAAVPLLGRSRSREGDCGSHLDDCRARRTWVDGRGGWRVSGRLAVGESDAGYGSYRTY